MKEAAYARAADTPTAGESLQFNRSLSMIERLRPNCQPAKFQTDLVVLVQYLVLVY